MNLGWAGQVVPWAILGAKVALVLFLVVALIVWRAASFARKRAYGPGGGRA